MKKILLLLALAFLLSLTLAGLCQAQTSTEQKLTQMEKDLWDGWKGHDASPAQKYLSSDAVIVSSDGVMDRDAMVKAMGSTDCAVASYSLQGDPKFTWIDKSTALMHYKANQDATCGGHKLPEAVWASTVWTDKGGSWKAAFHQESAVAPAMAAPEKKD